jgi:SPP1 gp7 family putative phage head morphogenesis protein
MLTYDEALRAIQNDLDKVYSRLLSGVDPEDYKNVLLQYNRLATIQTNIRQTYSGFSRQAGVQTREASRLAMSNNYYQQQFVLDFFTPTAGINLSFSAMPPAILEAAVSGTTTRWAALTTAQRTAMGEEYGAITGYLSDTRLTDTLLANRRNELLRLNRTISSGLLRGQSFAEISRGVRSVIDFSQNSASRVVRTEGNRTLNAGGFANSQQAESQGAEIKREWLATLDDRTRATHIGLDGEQVGIDEPFTINGLTAMYPGDFSDPAETINCRCTVIDIVGGVEPTARRGINPQTGESEIFNWSKYPDWAKANGLTETASGRWR